jgi:hypothetical protein
VADEHTLTELDIGEITAVPRERLLRTRAMEIVEKEAWKPQPCGLSELGG